MCRPPTTMDVIAFAEGELAKLPPDAPRCFFLNIEKKIVACISLGSKPQGIGMRDLPTGRTFAFASHQ